MEPILFKVFTNFSVSKDAKTGEVFYEGTASSTSVDRDDERMTKAALVKFASDLERPTSNGVFFNHKHTALKVGQIVKAWVSGDEMKIRFTKSKAEGYIGDNGPALKDIHIQMDEGIYNCMSIGGRVLDRKSVYDESLKKNIGEIRDVEGLEVSVVGIGANPDASISSALHKALKGVTSMSDETSAPAPAVSVPAPAPAEELKKENGPATPTAPPALPSEDMLGALGAKVNALEGRLAEVESRMPQGVAPIIVRTRPDSGSGGSGPSQKVNGVTRSLEEFQVSLKKDFDESIATQLNTFIKTFEAKVSAFEKYANAVQSSAPLAGKGLVIDDSKPTESPNPFQEFARRASQ